VAHRGGGRAYHREQDQEGFLVLRGSGMLLVEGEERPLRQWDYVHCPSGTAHMIVGGPITLLSIGARQHRGIEYVVDPLAVRHNAAPTSSDDPYAGWERPTFTPYDGWLE
jgi:glyoxylate utilization-related uncharacterized protein